MIKTLSYEADGEDLGEIIRAVFLHTSTYDLDRTRFSVDFIEKVVVYEYYGGLIKVTLGAKNQKLSVFDHDATRDAVERNLDSLNTFDFISLSYDDPEAEGRLEWGRLCLELIYAFVAIVSRSSTLTVNEDETCREIRPEDVLLGIVDLF